MNAFNKIFKITITAGRYLLTAILINAVFSFVLMAKDGLSQDLNKCNVSVVVENAALTSVFEKIEQQTSFKFSYDKKVESINGITLHVEHKSLLRVMQQLKRMVSIKYRQVNNIIAVVLNDQKSVAQNINDFKISTLNNITKPNFFTNNELFKEILISGKITDDTGQPMPGVNVAEKGTLNGTITDSDGSFSLKVKDKNSIIAISFVGFLSQEIVVGEQTNISVTMAPDVKQLEETVVVGYGIQKKINVTGAVATVDAASIQDRPVTNITSALQGNLPGAIVVQGSGQPGKDMATIRIRGVGTLNNSDPMYVVDGVVFNSINDIDPNDVQSISLLKDAASCAIYGSRASNGVILITTKKGGNKKLTLKFDSYLGKQTPTALTTYLGSPEYAELYNKARINQGQKAAYTADEIQKFRDQSDPDNYPDTDWFGLLYSGSGIQQDHRIEASGGTEKTTYMVSTGYLNQKGIIQNSDFKRYNTRANVQTTLGKFSAGLNFSFSHGTIHEPQDPSAPESGAGYFIQRVARMSPWIVNRYSNGYYGTLTGGYNPIYWQDVKAAVSREVYRTSRAVGNASYDLAKGLKIKEIVGYEYTGKVFSVFSKELQYYDWKTGNKTYKPNPNSMRVKRTDNELLNLQTLLTYDGSFGKHNINALAGYSQESYTSSWSKVFRKNFLNNEIQEIDAGSQAGQEATGSTSEYSLRSWFGRIAYNYNEKYLLEGNIRYDGTSRIVKESRWGIFPSFSAGWRVSEEPFMKELQPIISDFKLRAGWGILGNQNIGTYPYQSVLSSANYAFGEEAAQGVALKDGVNSDIRWESSESTNIGADMAFLSDKLTLDINYYVRNTTDILLELPVPTTFGLKKPWQNAGKVQNKGWEFHAVYRNRIGSMKYSIDANTAYNDNKVLDLKNKGARIWETDFRFLQEGYPINSFGGLNSLGLFRTEEDLNASIVINRKRAGLGDIKYEDVNGDSKISGDDRIFLGSSTPSWTYGTTLTADWKNFDISIFLYGAAKFKAFRQNEAVGSLQGSTARPTDLFLDSYDKDTNPNGNFPRPLTGGSGWDQNVGSAYPSSFWIKDASYLRLKNLQLGYSIPNDVCKKAGIERARIYYSVQNLFTISSLGKGFDPEAPAGTRSYYTQVKTHSLGLSLTF